MLRGGKGGKGNARFATPVRRAPRFATPGRKTRPREVILELKSIADVGLIGFPNVGEIYSARCRDGGKSLRLRTIILRRCSPIWGVVQYGEKSFVLADIPGLIEGASQGLGLGYDFLRHIERTRMLVHVIDASGAEGRDPVDDYYKIRKELEAYSQELAGRVEIVAANKADITGADVGYELLAEELEPRGIHVIPISAAAHTGTRELLDEIVRQLDKLPAPEPIEEEGVIEEWDMEAEELTFEVSRGMDGVVEANGSLIDDIFARIDPGDPDSMRHFEKLLVDFGIIAALRDFGVKDGEEVRLNGETFDFVE